MVVEFQLFSETVFCAQFARILFLRLKQKVCWRQNWLFPSQKRVDELTADAAAIKQKLEEDTSIGSSRLAQKEMDLEKSTSRIIALTDERDAMQKQMDQVLFEYNVVV